MKLWPFLSKGRPVNIFSHSFLFNFKVASIRSSYQLTVAIIFPSFLRGPSFCSTSSTNGAKFDLTASLKNLSNSFVFPTRSQFTHEKLSVFVEISNLCDSCHGHCASQEYSSSPVGIGPRWRFRAKRSIREFLPSFLARDAILSLLSFFLWVLVLAHHCDPSMSPRGSIAHP